MSLPDVRLEIIGAIAFEYCTADRARFRDFIGVRLLMPSKVLIACKAFWTSFAILINVSATIILWFLDDLVEW